MKKGKPNSTPPICIAVRLPFVQQYASHLYGSTFEKVLWVGVTGKFLNFLFPSEILLNLDDKLSHLSKKKTPRASLKCRAQSDLELVLFKAQLG